MWMYSDIFHESSAKHIELWFMWIETLVFKGVISQLCNLKLQFLKKITSFYRLHSHKKEHENGRTPGNLLCYVACRIQHRSTETSVWVFSVGGEYASCKTTSDRNKKRRTPNPENVSFESLKSADRYQKNNSKKEQTKLNRLLFPSIQLVWYTVGLYGHFACRKC